MYTNSVCETKHRVFHLDRFKIVKSTYVHRKKTEPTFVCTWIDACSTITMPFDMQLIRDPLEF